MKQNNYTIDVFVIKKIEFAAFWHHTTAWLFPDTILGGTLIVCLV